MVNIMKDKLSYGGILDLGIPNKSESRFSRQVGSGSTFNLNSQISLETICQIPNPTQTPAPGSATLLKTHCCCLGKAFLCLSFGFILV